MKTYTSQDVFNQFNPEDLKSMIVNYAHTDIGSDALPDLKNVMAAQEPQRTV